MNRSWQRVLVLLLLVVFGGSCTLLGIGQKKEKTTRDRVREQEAGAESDPSSRERKAAAEEEWDEPEEGEDEEAGVRSITKNLRRFNKALKARNFDKATKYLRRARRQTEKADDVTRSHPDFEDVEVMVDRAKNRLDLAIETDRIERRNAAIDDLIAQGEEAVAAANGLYVALAQRIPTEEDIAKLDELLGQLATLRTQGVDYLDEARYADHASDRDDKVVALEGIRAEAQWQVDASGLVGKNVESAYEAAVEARNSNTLTEQITGFHQSGLAFKQCATTIADLSAEKQYDPDKEIQTRFGALSLNDTKRRCVDMANKSRVRVANLSWRKDVEDVVSAVNTAMARVRAPKDANDELRRAREATDALSKCMLALDGTQNKEGFEQKRLFRTLLGGEMNAVVLYGACKSERSRLVRDLPGLEWKTTLSGLIKRTQETEALLKKVKSTRGAANRVPVFEQAVGGLKECVAQAKTLARRKGANKGLLLKTVWGKHNIVGLQSICDKKRQEVQKALALDIVQKDVDQFATTVRGDEKGVVKREGIPTRIETFSGGRIFIYERADRRGSKELRRFGFDKSGKRVDYWAGWRNEVVGVVSELTRVLGKVKSAPDATSLFAAVGDATPVLKVCVEVLGAGKKSPGFDAKALFKTPLGRLTVDKMIPACGKEQKRLQGSLTKINWRVRLERLRDRVNEAQAQLEKAERIKTGDARIKAVSTAMGGLQECIERAAVLPKESGADIKYKVTSVYGKLDVRGVQKACATMMGEAEKAAKSAIALKALEKFLKKCKADECEVAKREGVPVQIVRMGKGRVFVYGVALKSGKPAKGSKRFAFDGRGKRVNEKLLLAQISGEPEVVEMTKDGEAVPVPELEAPK